MVHNNGRPVTFLRVRMRTTETRCIFVGLSIIAAHLPLGLGKEKKIFANCIQRGIEPDAVRIPGMGCWLFKSKV